MDHRAPLDDNALIAGETTPAPPAPADDLCWAVVKMHAVERTVVNEPLIAAYHAASSPHSIRARIQLVRPAFSRSREGDTALPPAPPVECLEVRLQRADALRRG